MNMLQKFEDRYIPEPNSGCWLWLGSLHNGYGQLWDGRKGNLAHRFSYELHKGPIPDGLHIDHRCRVRCCVNPDHLEAVTLVENVMRGESFAPVNAAKTHCKYGHSFTADNMFYKGRERVCITCHRRASLATYHRSKKQMKIPVASHTMLQAFANCPWKGFRQYIAKDLPRFEPDAKQQRGNELHKAMQKHLASGKVLPDHFREYEPLARPLFAYNPSVELPLAIDKDGRPCGFYDDRVYVRGYADVVATRGNAAVVMDWKTGKKREEPDELKLHALMFQASHPTVSTIYGHYIWLQDKTVGKQHDLSDTHVTWSKLNEQMDEITFMAEQQNFPKTPNPLCGWCPVADCVHNKMKQRLESNDRARA